MQDLFLDHSVYNPVTSANNKVFFEVLSLSNLLNESNFIKVLNFVGVKTIQTKKVYKPRNLFLQMGFVAFAW